MRFLALLVVILSVASPTLDAASTDGNRVLWMSSSGNARRADIHGMPIGDPSPTGEEESDRYPNRTYIDMYSLGFQYSLSDVAIPLEGGELLLEFRRTASIQSRNYSKPITGQSIPPGVITYPTQWMLGLGWDTNLGGRLVVTSRTNQGGATSFFADVYDDTGAKTSFYIGGGSPNWTFEPDVRHSFSNDALRSKLLVGPGSTTITGGSGYLPTVLELTKEHGTKYRYQFRRRFDPAATVFAGSGWRIMRTEWYYRLMSITDRNGNSITYQYEDTITAPIPSAYPHNGNPVGGNSQYGPNGDLLPIRIFDTARPERRLDFGYEYISAYDEHTTIGFYPRAVPNFPTCLDSGWRLRTVTDPLGRVTTYNYGNTYGGPAAGWQGTSLAVISNIWPVLPGVLTSIAKPAVQNPANPQGALVSPSIQYTYHVVDLPDYVEEQPFSPTNEYEYGMNRFCAVSEIRDGNGNKTQLQYVPQQMPNSFFLWNGTAITSTTWGIRVSQSRVVNDSDPQNIKTDGWALFNLPNSGFTSRTTEAIDPLGVKTSYAFTSTIVDLGGTGGGLYLNDTGGGLAVSKVVRTTSRTGFANQVCTWDYTPGNINGNLIKVTDVSGNVITYDYDSGDAGDAFNKGVYKPTQAVHHYTNPNYYMLFGKPAKRTVDQGTGKLNLVTTYRYETNFKKLKSITDAESQTTTYTYDPTTGNLTSIAAPMGATTAHLYHSTGFLYRTTDPAGRITTYNAPGNAPIYSASTPLAYRTVKESIGGVETTTVFDIVGNVRSITNAKLKTTTHTYDNQNRLIATTKPTVAVYPSGTTSAPSEILYDYNGNVVQEKDEEGNVSRYTYDFLNRRLTTRRRMASPTADDAQDITTATTYNQVGLVASETDPLGRVTTYEYVDPFHRLTAKKLPVIDAMNIAGVVFYTGQVAETYSYAGNAGAGTWTTRSGWNPTRVISKRQTTGGTSFYDVAVDSVYDGAYRLTQQVRRYDTAVAYNAAPRTGEPTTQYTYTKVHKVSKVTALNDVAADHRNTYTFYDALHRPTLVVVDLDGDGVGVSGVVNAGLTATVDADDLASRTSYDLAGNVLKVRDALNRESETIYDSAGRVSIQKLPAVQVYDPVANTTSTVTPQVETFYDGHRKDRVKDLRGLFTKYFYDDRDRVTTVVQDLNNNGTYSTAFNGSDVVTTTAYDAVGNPRSVTDSRGNTTITAYDRAYRVTTVTLPAAPDYESGMTNQVSTTTSVYDRAGNVLEVWDPRGVKTVTTYDAWNRPRTATQAHGTAVAVTTETRYDIAGNVIALLLNNVGSGGVQSTTYTYDAYDRKLSETLPSPDGQSRMTTWTYFRTGEAKTQVDPKSQQRDLTYDRAGRLTTTVYKAAGGAVAETVSIQPSKTGKPLNISDGAGTTVYTYDAHDRVETETRTDTGQPAYAVTSAYSAAGDRTKVTYPDTATSLRSEYDRLGRLVKVTEGTKVTQYQYDVTGNRTKLTLPNGLVTDYAYDAQNRNTQSVEKKNGAAVLTYNYRFDRAGIRRWAEQLDVSPITLGNRTITYGYDAQYRLTSESWTGASRTYTYDLAGNRLTQVEVNGGTTVSTTLTYDVLNRLTGSTAAGTTISYGYDKNGNRTSRTVNGQAETYLWDTRDRLVSVTSNGTTETNVYDYRTRRVAKTLGSTTTRYRYDQGDCIQETAGAPASITVPAGTITTTVQYGPAAVVGTTESTSGPVISVQSPGDLTLVGGTVILRPGFRVMFGGKLHIQTSSSSATVAVEFIRGSGKGGGIGSILYARRGGVDESYHYEPAVGHVVALSDAAATWIKRDRYESFGKIIASAGASANNRLANTKEREVIGAVSIDNHGFRWYDAGIGRYLSRDPIGYGDGMNVYVYVHNSPVNSYDPLGLKDKWGEAKKKLEERLKEWNKDGAIDAANQRRSEYFSARDKMLEAGKARKAAPDAFQTAHKDYLSAKDSLDKAMKNLDATIGKEGYGFIHDTMKSLQSAAGMDHNDYIGPALAAEGPFKQIHVGQVYDNPHALAYWDQNNEQMVLSPKCFLSPEGLASAYFHESVHRWQHGANIGGGGINKESPNIREVHATGRNLQFMRALDPVAFKDEIENERLYRNAEAEDYYKNFRGMGAQRAQEHLKTGPLEKNPFQDGASLVMYEE